MAEIENDDDQLANGHDAQVTDEDVRALLAEAKREKAALGTQLEQERTARTRAESQAHNANSSRFEAEESAVKSRIEAADAAALGMRRKYSDALAEGRFDDAAQVQDELAELRAKQGQDKQYQTWLASEKERAAKAPPPQPQQQGLNLANYTPGQRKWIRENPDFMTDIKLRQKTEALHQLAVADGIEVDSPEYFEVINQAVKRKPAAKPAQSEEDDEDEDPPPRRRQQPSMDLPVSRRTETNGAPSRNQPVRLSADEREAADMTMPDLPEQGYMRDGNWVPSRYERYAQHRARQKARN